MKRIFALILALLAVFALCACGTEPVSDSEPVGNEENVGLANPMQESSQDALKSSTGYNLIAPEGATDCAWFEIAGEPVIAELNFTLDGKEYCLRAVAGDGLDESVSGMYYDWATVTDGASTEGEPTSFSVTETGAEAVFACYHDGATWCVSTADGADEAVMQAIVLDCIAAQ